MLYAYGITQQGAYHKKENIVCQDAHCIRKCSDNIVIAAVADGLGSELYSDIASNIAVETATKYCAERMLEDLNEEEILVIMQDAFRLSQQLIEEKARENAHELDQYDTTLSLAVLIKNTVYYGHCGDSGIVALTLDGSYEKVTEQQRDEEGRVFPLYFGDKTWTFGKYPLEVASVLLATDGMLETLFPIYIREEPISIYVALARFFMDADYLQIRECGEEAVCARIEKFLASIDAKQVQDDKTVVVLINTEVAPKVREKEYYEEPNWAELKRKREEAWKREAYPHLFNRIN